MSVYADVQTVSDSEDVSDGEQRNYVASNAHWELCVSLFNFNLPFYRHTIGLALGLAAC